MEGQAVLRAGETVHLLADLRSGEPRDLRGTVDAIYDKTGLFDEHTWGAANPWHDHEHGSGSGGLQWSRKAEYAHQAYDDAQDLLHGAVRRLGATFTSAPVSIAVKPLPDGPPVAAVGEVALNCSAPKQRNTDAEKKAIKEGRSPEDWKAKPAKLRQKDRDARWTLVFGKARLREDGSQHAHIAIPVFGYKSHASIGRRHGFIRKCVRPPRTAFACRALACTIRLSERKVHDELEPDPRPRPPYDAEGNADLVDSQAFRTNRRTDDLANRFGNLFLEAGVEPEQRVIVALPDGAFHWLRRKYWQKDRWVKPEEIAVSAPQDAPTKEPVA